MNNAILQQLENMGYTTIDGEWYDRIAAWDEWYKGDVKKFHNYTVWTGQHRIKCRRYTLGMAKKICEDWANLLMNEKVKITLEGEKEQSFIDEIFEREDFEVNANELQERGAARGTYAFIPRIENATVTERGVITSGGQIALDYVTAEQIYPLSWQGREIRECAFGTLKVEGEEKYLYLQIHHLDGKEYVIENRFYRYDNDILSEIDPQIIDGVGEIPPIVRTGSDKPQFIIGRYNIANNIEDNNPMGISVYANAIDILKGCDICYDSYINEFVLGKKRIMVQPTATKKMDGEEVFDPNDVVYYVLPEDIGDGSIIQPIDMSLRVGDHNRGLQDQLNMLSSKCGFGEEHYKFEGGSVATATQIVSENSEMFRTIKKHEIILESVLMKLLRTLLRMGNNYLNAGLNEEVEISIDFDDSIIIDKATEEARIYQMLAAGLMKPDEARSLLMNEDIETARAALPQMTDLTTEGQNEVE